MQQATGKEETRTQKFEIWKYHGDEDSGHSLLWWRVVIRYDTDFSEDLAAFITTWIRTSEDHVWIYT
jgi:hypothetical protein